LWAPEQQGESQQPQPPPASSSLPSSEPAVTNIANKLDATTLTPPSTQLQTQQQQQQQSQPQPKQKRNRQKERLARRAAEQEAAAQAAEAEASNMTDRRGLERERMQRELAAHSLREHEIAPDGHCLFSAVADQLEVNGIPFLQKGEGLEGFDAKMEPYRVVRRAAADWIAGHRDEYAGFLEEGVEEYVGKIRDTAEWGGQLELSALANAYGVEIKVVQGDGRPVEVVTPTSPATGEEKEGEGEGEEKKKKTLWLAYYRHGYGLGEHYNSLRKAKVVQ
jgi:OTU domain-containing protein 6